VFIADREVYFYLRLYNCCIAIQIQILAERTQCGRFLKDDVPPKASLLYSVEVPPTGGNTSFCTMYGIYEALPTGLKDRMASLKIKHDGTYNSGGYVRQGVTATDDPVVYARHGMAITDKIGAVIFASPDIDMDVFTSSVQRIPPLVPKITVITATNDRALAVAGWIAGGITRVGAAEKSQLEKVGLRVIDASAEGWGLINHDLFLSNAQIRLVIRRAVDGLPLDHS
jgi:Alpha/beta hydrolase of unknown function (DUF900)/Taurine catabolism dioxygenase TauD, TfdA family